METGDLISFYRKQAGMTIDELAEKSGVPKGTLTKIICGITKAPTLDNMKSIARALGKTLADFDDLPIDAKNPPAPVGTGTGGKISAERVEAMLIELGYIKPGDDLTDADLRFLMTTGEIIRAWFAKGK